MTQLPVRSSPPPPLSRRPSRRGWLSKDQDVRSIQVGVVLTLILWPLTIWVASLAMRQLTNSGANSAFTPKPQKPTFSIELAPEEFQMPKKEPPPPNRFVETNPDAPENVPDKTRNFGAHNQQVAQEKPTPDGTSDTPATEGKKDHPSNAIVSGQLSPPQETPPPAPPPSPEVMEALAQAQAQRAQTPLPGFEKVEGTSDTGYGFNISKPDAATPPTPVPEKLEGTPDAPLIVGAPQATQPRIDPQRPQPRPRIDRRARPAILAENPYGTRNIGPVAFDARWSQYGQYLTKLIETVQIQWENIIDVGRIYPPPGTTVTIKFRIEGQQGAIAEIIEAEGNGGRQAVEACKSAITARAPYGKWSEEMFAVLGESQELTFTFYYNP